MRYTSQEKVVVSSIGLWCAKAVGCAVEMKETPPSTHDPSVALLNEPNIG
jgi:hypothetical protein